MPHLREVGRLRVRRQQAQHAGMGGQAGSVALLQLRLERVQLGGSAGPGARVCGVAGRAVAAPGG